MGPFLVYTHNANYLLKIKLFKHMHRLLTKLLILVEFLIGVPCMYAGLFSSFTHVMQNIVLLVVGIFVIVIACGHIDELNGYGGHKKETDDDN